MESKFSELIDLVLGMDRNGAEWESVRPAQKLAHELQTQAKAAA
ncbi:MULTISPECIES: hypothetical protein [Arthrobacter]|nr:MULTISPECIES: hypothetical protein [Arthrobacter]